MSKTEEINVKEEELKEELQVEEKEDVKDSDSAKKAKHGNKLLEKAKGKVKKALPYIGVAVASAALTAGAIVAKLALSAGEDVDEEAIEKDDSLVNVDDFIDGECEIIEETEEE